jgi:hypothetical protein
MCAGSVSSIAPTAPLSSLCRRNAAISLTSRPSESDRPAVKSRQGPFHAPPAPCRLATSGIIDRIEAALSVYGRGEPLATERAEVAEWQTRYVQGVVFERTCGFNSHPRHHETGACSSVGLERSPAEAKAVGSSPTRRTSGRLAQRFRASVLHTEGRRFKSCTAHHQNPQNCCPIAGLQPDR